MKILSFVVVIILALSANASLRSDSPNTVIANSFYVLIDANKNLTAESSTGTAMTGYGFDASFDDIDRVTQWDRDNATESQTWTLDKIGNWDNTTGSLAGTAFNETRTHNGVHELTAMGSNSITYDDKGNMTTDANANDYIWDIDNHLVTVLDSGGTVATFTYDALGRRLEKKTFSGNTLFICDGQRVIEEYEDYGSGYALARSYIHGSYIDDVVGKVEDNSGSPEILFYHSDRQYNVRGLSNSTGNIIELYAYSVYGQQTVMDDTGSVIGVTAENNSYGFTGRYLDNETGLWYFRARYFNDEMGRFINRDPLGYVDGMSLYNGYFAQGFALDPWGMEKHVALPESKGGQPGQGLYVFTPKKPNKNVCSNPREVILVAGTRDNAMQVFGKRFEKKLKEEGNGSVKDVSELTSKLSGGNIKYLLLNAHGNRKGKVQLNKGYLNIIPAFKREDFCCKCIIWLSTCYTANSKTPQTIAKATGCKVFAWNRECFSERGGKDLGKTFNALIKKSNKEHEKDPDSDSDWDWNPDPKTTPTKVKQP